MSSFKRPGLVLTLLVLGSGCSSFNMAMPCSRSEIGLMRSLAVLRGEKPDDARLASLMQVSHIEEVSADYNQRRCSAEVTAFGDTHRVVYTIRQTEGVRGWTDFELPSDDATWTLRAQLRAAYAG